VSTVFVNRNRLVGENAPVPSWPKSAVRIGFGLIWLVDAVFKWLPDFHKGILGMAQGAASGQPAWLHWWFNLWVGAVKAHPDFWAYGIAVLETGIALALIFGFARKTTYIVTIVSALFIWGVAEGFGGPYNGASTDIGAAVMYAVVAVSLLVGSLQSGPSRYSVDYWIEQRVSWWHKVAEFGAHNHPAARENTPAPPATQVVPVVVAVSDTAADRSGSPLPPPEAAASTPPDTAHETESAPAPSPLVPAGSSH
jgi:nitrite reductase (NO-forming)